MLKKKTQRIILIVIVLSMISLFLFFGYRLGFKKDIEKIDSLGLQ